MKTVYLLTRLFFLLIALVGLKDSLGCSNTAASNNTSSTTCASGTNDIYVVENASCVDGAGKLSRVNPDASCKQEVLTGLNCPVDIVLSTEDANIGYLSSRSDGIYQVNLSSGTKTLIVTDKTITSAAGLFLLEDITETEREDICGGNTLVDAILLIADEGTEEGGMVWRWCLITDDATILSSGLNPNPVSELPPSQVQNPRGVAVLERTRVFVTGHNPDIEDSTQSAILGTWVLNALESNVVEFLTDPGDLSEPKDLMIDSDGTILLVDSGQEAVFRYDRTDDTLTQLSPTLSGGPRDVLKSGTEYLVSQFDDANVVSTTFTANTTPSNITQDLTLATPDGIAKKE